MLQSDTSKTWHAFPAGHVIDELRVDPARGLSPEEASARLAAEGTNEIPKHKTGVWPILWRQFRSIMVAVLVAAALISYLSGDIQDAVAILAMLLLTTLLGFRQDYRAERAMSALESLAAPSALVLRAGAFHTIPARDLVRGDIVLIEAGSRIPADLRLLESHVLHIDESALTGESQPVEKDSSSLAQPDTALGDRLNMAYSGTTVTAGRGMGMVVAVGLQTEMGHVAGLVQQGERQMTPLQAGLEKMGRKLVWIALGITAIVFVQGLLRGDDRKMLLLTSVSLAVAAIPEGLPAVIVIVLAMGSQRMLARRALIRRLAAVETLGSVTVICSDKTGTLTRNQLTVAQAYVDGTRLDVGKAGPPAPAVQTLLACAALSTDATRAGPVGTSLDTQWVGDPTEVALVRAADEADVKKESLETLLPRVSELPFDSSRKRMTTVHRVLDALPLAPLIQPGQEVPHVVITKGALDVVLPRSTSVWSHGSVEPLTVEDRARIIGAHDDMAKEGVRVLGVAFRPLLDATLPEPAELESDLVFLGFVGILDPPRPEARDAIALCKQAGITPVMITGDHALTAQYIARQLGIGSGASAMSSSDLQSMITKADLKSILDTAVVARVSPEDKLMLVEALQKGGHVVAMTGDGVNDAPALSRADVGVAMGLIGTDTARGASDMVLQDDNFATIVAAVEEGRLIGSNIRKFIGFLLTCNSGELWVVLLAPLFGMPLPLTPLQILWINLVTDGLPALALAAEPAHANVMRRPPRPPRQELLGTVTLIRILGSGLLLGLVAFLSGYGYWKAGDTAWQTVVFTVMVFSQLGMAVSCRSESEPVLRVGLFSNRSMTYAIAGTAVLQLMVTYLPLGQRIFHSLPLPVDALLMSLAASAIPFLGLELAKWWRREDDRAGD